MKIATWNIERPTKNDKRSPLLLDILRKIDADILVLTETNEYITLGDKYNSFHSTNVEEAYYKKGEKRVSIYSKYKAVGQIKTFTSETSICINLETPSGILAIYGTVIGTEGNRKPSFIKDLDQQIVEFENISLQNNLCIAGDFNISFSDNYYFTNEGRKKLNDVFDKLDLTNLTSNIKQNIDHIVLPNKFIFGKEIIKDFWNQDKKLSDHIGVSVTIL